MAAPKINSFQLSDICSLGIMTAHRMSHHVLFKLDFFTARPPIYLHHPQDYTFSFFQLLKGRENI